VLTPQREEKVPTYEYACTECGDKSEVVQRFSDDPLTVCTQCGGRLRKVFSPVGIVFKGSGFYRTDSRNGSGAAAKDAAAKGSNGTSAEGSGASSSSESAKDGSPKSESSGDKAASSSSKSDSSGGDKKSSVAAAS
jgi:putative FmdB family regulatory protein